MRSLAREFKQFVLRGSVVDLAVGIIIGTAFSAVVTALVADLLTPLVAAIFGQPDFATMHFKVHGSTFRYGDFINKAIALLIVALALFLFVIKPINLLVSLHRQRKSPDPTMRKCPECLSDIPLRARRCAFCTSEVGEAREERAQSEGRAQTGA